MVYCADMAKADLTEFAGRAGDNEAKPVRSWTFLTNQAHVLVCLARDGELTMRQLAQSVGITERAVQAIISDLIEDGYLTRVKDGRRNSYTVREEGRMRHRLESAHNVGELLAALR